MTPHSPEPLTGGDREYTLELVKLVASAVISLVVIIGGGALVASHPEMKAEVGIFVGTCLGHWVGKVGNGNGGGSRRPKP